MDKSDIEELWDLELEKNKKLQQRAISKDELYFTALDFYDEIVIIRSKIKKLSSTGIIVITNPDRAEKDGELYQLIALESLKMAIFTLTLSEDEILELLEIVEEPIEAEYDED